MSNKTKNSFRNKFKNYFLVGLSAFATEFIVFLGIFSLMSNLIAAQTISFLSGLLVSFLGNRNITFTQHTQAYSMGATRQLISYVALALINLLLSNIVIHWLVDGLAVPVLAAKAAVMVMVVGWNYLIFNRYIFRSE